MKIGIIGAGRIGLALTKHFVSAGHQLIIANSRGPESLSEIASSIGSNVTAATLADVAKNAEIIVLSAPWAKLRQIAASLPELKGKIIIDTTNNIINTTPFTLDDIGASTTGEIVAKLFPGAKIVKAFNTLPAAVLDQSPNETVGNRVIFISGDDKTAKNEIAALISDIGFVPVDLGTMDIGGKLQAVGASLSGVNLLKSNDAELKAISVVRRNTEEVQGAGNFEIFDQLFADDFVDHTPQAGMESNDKESVRQLYMAIRKAFPDFKPVIHWQTSDGEKVTTFKTYYGTHKDGIFGIPPSGKKIHFETVDVMRVKNGKITDHWGVANLLSLINQLK